MDTKHTPTPWLIVGVKRAVKQSNFGNYRTTISAQAKDNNERAFYETVAHALGGVKDEAEVSEANAAFIVRACNAHEPMKANLDGLLYFADEYADFCKSKGTTDARLEQLIRDSKAQLAALAKAEGK